MRQSTRLIVNSLAVYLRMVLTVGIGLYTTRLVFRLLGDVDYGLLSVLGAGGGLLLIFSDALVGSAQRHLAHELGRGDRQQLRIVFSTSVILFFAAGLTVLLVGGAISFSLVHVLAIPVERQVTCYWVFLMTLVMLAANVWGTPFRAMMTAHQSMILLSFLELLQSVLQLAAAVLLISTPGDRLMVYALALLVVTGITTLLSVGVCLLWYPEGRPSLGLFRWSELRSIGRVAGWGVLGGTSWRLFMQGATIILNLAFGPLANAAYAVALQLNGYQNSLAEPIRRTVQPVLSYLYARNEQSRLQFLVLAASKYQVILMLYVAIPIMLETEGLLTLWLGSSPPYTSAMLRWIVFGFMAFYLTNGFDMLVLATGKLAHYTLLSTATNCLYIVVPALLFATVSVGPWAMPAAFAVITILTAPLRAFYAGQQIGLSVRAWSRHVLAPVAAVAVVGMAAAATAHLLLEPSPHRLFVVACAHAVAAAPATWILALGPDEKQHFLRMWRQLIRGILPGGPDQQESQGDSSLPGRQGPARLP